MGLLARIYARLKKLSLENELRELNARLDETSKECQRLGCQCYRCGFFTRNCCCLSAHKCVLCPDDDDFDPSYQCPDFVEKEETGNAP